MKCYICYMVIPDSDLLLYRNIYDQRYFRYDRSIDSWIGVYGISTNKDIFNKFYKIRNKKLFTMKKIDIDSDEKENIMRKYKYAIVSNCKLKISDDETIEVPMTKNEYIGIHEDFKENKYMIIADLCKIDYRFFNEDIQKILDDLTYNYNFDTLVSDNEADIDMANWNASFRNNDWLDRMFENEFGIFIYTYKKILDINSLISLYGGD